MNKNTLNQVYMPCSYLFDNLFLVARTEKRARKFAGKHYLPFDIRFKLVAVIEDDNLGEGAYDVIATWKPDPPRQRKRKAKPVDGDGPTDVAGSTSGESA
jgi:hypothetical protein